MDRGNVKNASNIFSWLGLKMLLANQIATFLNQLYSRNELMNLLDFRYVDIESGNIEDSL